VRFQALKEGGGDASGCAGQVTAQAQNILLSQPTMSIAVAARPVSPAAPVHPRDRTVGALVVASPSSASDSAIRTVVETA